MGNRVPGGAGVVGLEATAQKGTSQPRSCPGNLENLG